MLSSILLKIPKVISALLPEPWLNGQTLPKLGVYIFAENVLDETRIYSIVKQSRLSKEKE